VIGGSCHYDKDVNNGDIGYIDNVDPDAGELNASFDGRLVRYGLGELDTLVPAYASAQVAACWR
jgi:exodeoxyribonuclease V alpha subunit